MGINVTELIRQEIFKREDCMFFDELLTMMTALTSYLLATELIHKKTSPIIDLPEDRLEKLMRLPFPSSTADELYVYSFYNPLKAIVSNNSVTQLTFDVHKGLGYNIRSRQDIHYVQQPYSFNQRIIGAALVNFYESKTDEIKSKFGNNSSTWPNNLNFIRVIRNAFAHGGEIHFTNISAPPVTWNSLTYSPADNGTSIYNDIFVVEVIELMKVLENQIK